jgi:hypothetical protein
LGFFALLHFAAQELAAYCIVQWVLLRRSIFDFGKNQGSQLNVGVLPGLFL